MKTIVEKMSQTPSWPEVIAQWLYDNYICKDHSSLQEEKNFLLTFITRREIRKNLHRHRIDISMSFAVFLLNEEESAYSRMLVTYLSNKYRRQKRW